MAIQALANQIRGAREKWAVIVAEALVEIERAILGLTTSIGFTSDLKGIQKVTLLAQRIVLLMPNGQTIALQLYAENGAAIMDLQAAAYLRFSAQNIPYVTTISPGDIQINAAGPFVVNMADVQGVFDPTTGDFSATMSIKGGVTAGIKGSAFIDATKNYVDHLLTFVDAVGGNSIAQHTLNAAGGVLVQYKKGADNNITLSVDAVNVVQRVSNVTHTTTFKPESVATSRLGVGVAAPAADGHAVVGVFLGANATTVSAGENLRVGGNARVDAQLGIGMNPARALDVTGDAKITGTLEVDSAAQFDSTVTITPLASGDVLLAQSGGTITTISPGTARFLLDVYSKAEVDAAIAAAIAAIVVDNALVGTPEEHNHSLS